MYDGIYKAMVKSGVAIETSEEIYYNKIGHSVLDKTYMHGCPTQFCLITP
jgi:hypothetical protein